MEYVIRKCNSRKATVKVTLDADLQLSMKNGQMALLIL